MAASALVTPAQSEGPSHPALSQVTATSPTACTPSPASKPSCKKPCGPSLWNIPNPFCSHLQVPLRPALLPWLWLAPLSAHPHDRISPFLPPTRWRPQSSCLLLTSPYQSLAFLAGGHSQLFSGDPLWAEAPQLDLHLGPSPNPNSDPRIPNATGIPPSASCHCPGASGETWGLNHYDAYPEATHQTGIKGCIEKVNESEIKLLSRVLLLVTRGL